MRMSEQRADALAALEVGHSITAGSLLPETFERRVEEIRRLEENNRDSYLTLFSRLVNMKRRDAGISLDELAGRADIDVLDLLKIESNLDEAPEPRVVARLAKVLNLPAGKLMQLVGHVTVLDPAVSGAAHRFAAKSDSMKELSKSEKDALTDFITALSAD
jgi:HTH-type transcriptional regulator, competence development regulator